MNENTIVPEEIEAQILDLKAKTNMNWSIVRTVNKQVGDMALSRKYVNTTLDKRKQDFASNPELYKLEGLPLIKLGLKILLIPLVVALAYVIFEYIFNISTTKFSGGFGLVAGAFFGGLALVFVGGLKYFKVIR